MTEPRRTTFVSTLNCNCGATFEVHSAGSDPGLTVCGFCGGSLVEISHTTGSTAASDIDDGDEVQVTVTQRSLVPGARRSRAGADAEPAVHVRRGRSPDTWTLTIPALVLDEFGFTYEEAMAKLLIAVRSWVRRMLDDPDESRPKRELARKLQTADTEGGLERLLGDALVLDDERSERMLREHREEAGDSPPTVRPSPGDTTQEP